MKTIKRLSCILLVLLITLVIVFPTAVIASEVPYNNGNHDVIQGSAAVAGQTPCSYGYHDMARRGGMTVVGAASSGFEYQLNGHGWALCWQCTKCYHVMGTSDDPASYSRNIGNYVVDNPGYQISALGTVLYTDTLYSYNGILPGYYFRYN